MRYALTFAAALALATGANLSGAGAVAQQPSAPGPAPAAKPTAVVPGQAAKPAGDRGDKKDRPDNPLGLGSNSKEPVKIDSDRLDVFDRESRAVFTGNVIAVQGDSTMRCTTLTVHYEQRGQGSQRAAGAEGDAIKRIDCAGPVTVVSKDQVATGDNATFDRQNNRVVLTGNVALSQCQNVTRGERIVYDMNTGVANVETAPGGRVRALFMPGSDQQKQGCQPQAGAQPVAAPAPAPTAVAKPSTPAAPAQPAAAAPKAAQKQRAQAN